MPDTPHGWWGYYNCADFSPEMESAKKIRKSGRIVCHDIEVGGWNHEDWVWTYDGKPLNPKGNAPPMWPVKTERVGNALYLNAG